MYGNPQFTVAQPYHQRQVLHLEDSSWSLRNAPSISERRSWRQESASHWSARLEQFLVFLLLLLLHFANHSICLKHPVDFAVLMALWLLCHSHFCCCCVKLGGRATWESLQGLPVRSMLPGTVESPIPNGQELTNPCVTLLVNGCSWRILKSQEPVERKEKPCPTSSHGGEVPSRLNLAKRGATPGPAFYGYPQLEIYIDGKHID